MILKPHYIYKILQKEEDIKTLLFKIQVYFKIYQYRMIRK